MTLTSGSTALTFDTSDNRLLTMALDSTNKVITFTLLGQNGETPLKPATEYEASFKSPTVTNSDKSFKTMIAAGTTYRITTKN